MPRSRPNRTPVKIAASTPAPAAPPAPPLAPAPRGPEKSLHELNLEARAIDQAHAARRAEAETIIAKDVEPLLAGIMRPRRRREAELKPLRPPVTR